MHIFDPMRFRVHACDHRASHSQFADSISSKARRFVTSLLIPDDEKRPSAAEATRKLCETFKLPPPAGFSE